MLLKEIVEGKRYAFYKEAADWKDAIKKSCSPLVATNCATEEYAQRIIECVEELGPYIVIVPGFDENDLDKDAALFFTLAAVDEEEHLKNMRQLFLILSDEELLEKLAQANTAEELLELDQLLS